MPVESTNPALAKQAEEEEEGEEEQNMAFQNPTFMESQFYGITATMQCKQLNVYGWKNK